LGNDRLEIISTEIRYSGRKVSFTLPGIPVAKKNRRRNYGNKSLPSVNYLTWEAMACAEIAQCWEGPTIGKIEYMTLHFYIDTQSQLDTDNCVTSCCRKQKSSSGIIGKFCQDIRRTHSSQRWVEQKSQFGRNDGRRRNYQKTSHGGI